MNSSVSSSDGTTYNYADLVAINPTNGDINVIANGFQNPLAVIADQNGDLLVSDYGAGAVYFVSPVPEPSTLVVLLWGVPAAAWFLRHGSRHAG